MGRRREEQAHLWRQSLGVGRCGLKAVCFQKVLTAAHRQRCSVNKYIANLLLLCPTHRDICYFMLSYSFFFSPFFWSVSSGTGSHYKAWAVLKLTLPLLWSPQVLGLQAGRCLRAWGQFIFLKCQPFCTSPVFQTLHRKKKKKQKQAKPKPKLLVMQI